MYIRNFTGSNVNILSNELTINLHNNDNIVI